jgi:methionyl-tRNA formyltransferase
MSVRLHRAIFFVGQHLFSASTLRAWLALGHEVAAVLQFESRPDRGGDRPSHFTPRWSLGATIAHHHIERRRLMSRADLAKPWPDADLAISVGFPLRIPMQFLAALPRGGVNLHPSLLPAFRGPRPITALCLEGAAERCGGVSLHLLSQDFDSGPLLAQEAVPFRGDFDAWTIELALAHGRLMRPLDAWLAGRLEPVPQDESCASYHRPPHPRLSPEQPVGEIARLCRTLGARKRVLLTLGEHPIAIRGYLGHGPRTAEPPRIGRFSVSFDARDGRVRLARWLPGTGRWRSVRWQLRLALAERARRAGALDGSQRDGAS